MEKYTVRDFDKDFPDDDACLDWLFKARWPDGVTCERCQRITPHFRIKSRACYSCESCGNHIYPMSGTVFQDTRLSHLRLWFKAVGYMAVTRCGISSRQLSRDLGVGVKTGWRMFTQIRKVLAEGEPLQFLGIVEVDETYIGGKDQNRHASKRSGKRGRGAGGKTPVVGVVQRKGKVKAVVVQNVEAKTLETIIKVSVRPGTIIHTDDFSSYGGLSKLGFPHGVVNHSQKIYVTADGIHTNTIEGFWSQLKRSINGTYHWVSVTHLQKYVDEYGFRYSHRHDEQPMFITMLNRVVRHASEAALR